MPFPPSRDSSLTSRQREVVQLLTDGKTMEEAGPDGNSARTAESHKYEVMRQLGFTSTAGNINAAVYRNVKLKVNSYPRDAFMPSHEKEEVLTQCINTGTWNAVEVILPNTKCNALD